MRMAAASGRVNRWPGHGSGSDDSMVRHVYVAATFEANGDRTVKGYRGASPLGCVDTYLIHRTVAAMVTMAR